MGWSSSRSITTAVSTALRCGTSLRMPCTTASWNVYGTSPVCVCSACRLPDSYLYLSFHHQWIDHSRWQMAFPSLVYFSIYTTNHYTHFRLVGCNDAKNLTMCIVELCDSHHGIHHSVYLASNAIALLEYSICISWPLLEIMCTCEMTDSSGTQQQTCIIGYMVTWSLYNT